MIDEQLLDDAEALERADRLGALLALASAGARIRSGARAAQEAGLAQLRPEGRPRALLVAGHGAAAQAAAVLAALGGQACPVHILRPVSGAAPPDVRSDAYPVGLQWSLPGWAGPADLLVVASTHGAEAGLVALVERGYQSGCTVVAVAPPGSPLGDAALQARGMPLPYLTSPGSAPSWDRDPDLVRDDPGDLWAMLASLLSLTHRLALTSSGPEALSAAADLLDDLAVRCGPMADAYQNPAKSLALRLDGSLPLIWTDGPLADAASVRFADMLAEHAARPALAAALPEALVRHRGLLESAVGPGDPSDHDDFFRDRTEEPTQRPAIVLLHRQAADEGEADPQPQGLPTGSGVSGRSDGANGPAIPGESPVPGRPDAGARPSLSRARRLAALHGTPLYDLAATSKEPLTAVAELIALSDFCAVYLGLAAHPWGD
ncbi:SIS domain-containing protein [Streptacidiphilus monticola]|uniref:SIS domain-containing protein n=1 Tax=Streptacidiphilus monticola TaxID=2161674 RepID=A0ABW1G808_9ACTN